MWRDSSSHAHYSIHASLARNTTTRPPPLTASALTLTSDCVAVVSLMFIMISLVESCVALGLAFTTGIEALMCVEN